LRLACHPDEETGNEAIEIFRRRDHRHFEGASGGLSATELCRKYGVSDATFYKWRSKYGGMDVSEAKRLKSLEEEKGKLKRLLADAMLDVSTLREMLEKTSDAWVKENRRDLGDREQGLYAASCVRARRHGAAGLPLSFEPTGRR
jgi:putative transposase